MDRAQLERDLAAAKQQYEQIAKTYKQNYENALRLDGVIQAFQMMLTRLDEADKAAASPLADEDAKVRGAQDAPSNVSKE